MPEIAPLALRPRRFSEMIGLETITSRIQKQVAGDRLPHSWLLAGDTGCGKTTLAYILALSLQIPRARFGEPTEEDWSNWDQYDIREINASAVNGIAELGQVAKEADYVPSPGSRARVIFLDEAHRISSAAQNMLLKPLEFPKPRTYWFLGTSEPDKLIAALKRRCYEVRLPSMTDEQVVSLLKRAKKQSGFEGPIKPLAERLSLTGVSNPGIVLMAFEAYMNGASAKDALKAGSEQVDGLSVCRAVLAGNWEGVQKEMRKAVGVDPYRAVRLAVVGYLRSVLLNSSGKKADACAAGIKLLTAQGPPEEPAFCAWVLSALYQTAKGFRQ